MLVDGKGQGGLAWPHEAASSVCPPTTNIEIRGRKCVRLYTCICISIYVCICICVYIYLYLYFRPPTNLEIRGRKWVRLYISNIIKYLSCIVVHLKHLMGTQWVTVCVYFVVHMCAVYVCVLRCKIHFTYTQLLHNVQWAMCLQCGQLIWYHINIVFLGVCYGNIHCKCTQNCLP